MLTTDNLNLITPPAPTKTEVFLDKSQALLKIQANPDDPTFFQTFYCATCANFVNGSGILPPVTQSHPGHALAWMPAIDAPVEGQILPVINHWLQFSSLSESRRQQLRELAFGSSTLRWVLTLEPEERPGWLEHFSVYLNKLADEWLAAVNGLANPTFSVARIWLGHHPDQHFSWLAETITG